MVKAGTHPRVPTVNQSRFAPDLMKPLPPEPLNITKTPPITPKARIRQIPPGFSKKDPGMSVNFVHLVLLTNADGKGMHIFSIQPDGCNDTQPMTVLGFRNDASDAVAEEWNFF
jgi:hypothetical protein